MDFKGHNSDLLLEYEPCRAVRSSDSGQIVEPRAQTKHGEAAFSFYAEQKWKKLYTDLKSAPPGSVYFRLKVFLFLCAQIRLVFQHLNHTGLFVLYFLNPNYFNCKVCCNV